MSKYRIYLMILGGLYGLLMASVEVDFSHPGFWIGAVYGILMAFAEFRWGVR